MAFEDRFNRAQFPVQLGVPVTFNLNRGLKIIEGHVIVTGTLTIAGGAANGVAIEEQGANAVVNLIRRIRVIANKAAGSRYPDGSLVRCTPTALLRYATVEHQGKYMGELLGNGALGGGAPGAYQIYLDIPIYFGDSVQNNNVQTALNMDPVDSQGNPIYTAVQVQIEFAQLLSELFAGSDRTMTFAGMCQWKDDRLGLTSDTTPLIQEDHLLFIQNANNRLVDAAMPNDGLFNSWLLLAEQNAPGWQFSNNLLNKIEMEAPGPQGINFKEYALDMQQQMYNDGFYDPNQLITGQYFIDFTHGLLQNSIPAVGLQHILDVNNPSGAGLDRFKIYTRRVFPLA